MTRTVLGHTVHRTEDATLLDGSARYVDDIAVVSDAVWTVFVRSAFAHAELLAVDVRDACAGAGSRRGVHRVRSRVAAAAGDGG